MTRKFSLLLVLALFLLSIANVTAFAAKAKMSNGTAGLVTGNVPALPVAGAEIGDGGPSGSKAPHAAQTVLGFDPQFIKTVGSTYYDYQQNGSMGRQIAGGNGWVHGAWMHAFTASATVDRDISYYGYKLDNTDSIRVDNVEGIAPAGYCNIGVAPVTGLPVITYHRSAIGSRFGQSFNINDGSFELRTWPVANCQGIISGTDPTEGFYLWPKIAVDRVGGQTIAHVLAQESPATANAIASLVYYRSSANVDTVGVTCGLWIDTVDNITSVIAADPNSDNVAMAYITTKDYAFSGLIGQKNGNVVYRENTAGGVGGIATWPKVNITNYTGANLERAYCDLDVMYTSDGCLHIAWSANFFDSTAGSSSTQQCKLRHWDDCNQCISLASDASYTDGTNDRGAWNVNISKMNLSECTIGATKRLYLTYTRFPSTDAAPDGSADAYANGEIYAQASSTSGLTWGPPTNLTNTVSNNCAAGACKSEHWSSSVMYVTDSLRIQYIEDVDAGGVVQTEGSWQNSPVKWMSRDCFTMASYTDVGATPSEFTYPFHTTPAQVRDEIITLANSGNVSASWSVATPASFISFVGPTSGSCGAGCLNTATFTARFTGPVTEGYYASTINVTVTSPDKGADAVVAIPVELYNFVRWTLPKDVSIRTSLVRMNVNQASEIADNKAGRMFSYFSDTSDYITDGFLIIGNSVNNLSYSTFGGGGSVDGGPSVTNQFGYLYASSDSMTSDSTTFGGYRTATGKGYNRDSTLEFNADYYAPKHPDSANFMILRYMIYHGPKDTGTAITGLTVAYYADIDVPSDTSSNNLGGFDTTLTGTTRRATLYQHGTIATSPANNQNRYAALGGAVHQGFAPIGGMITANPTYIYPDANWENDSLWNRLSLIPTGGANSGGRYFVDAPHTDPAGSTGEDLNSTVLFYRGAQIRSLGRHDTLGITVIVAGSPKTGNFAALTGAMDRAYKFMRTNKLRYCRCGDADGNGAISISDAVKTINFIFAGGSAPNPLCRGDADGNGSISISDAVKLINFIFGGGSAPEKC
jgi:hypothetical protein